MRMKAQLKMLISDISCHSNRHLAEIESDLVQTNMLLDEAITQLTESFEGIAKGVGAYQQAMVELLSSPAAQLPGNADGMSHIGAVNEILTLHINSAVTKLQFEDITSQLIRRVIRRVEGLKEMIDFLGSAAIEELDSGVETGTRAESLEQMLEDVRTRSQLIDVQLRKAVAQSRLDSGDMELF